MLNHIQSLFLTVGPLSVILQIVLCVHVYRTGRPFWWIWLIMMGSLLGCLLYLFLEVLPDARRNNSRMMRLNRALHEKNEELEAALAKVNLLSGLLPICAGCKQIRDDKGYWIQVESYIQKHSEVTFTHGMCPKCIEKYYPDLEGEKT